VIALFYHTGIFDFSEDFSNIFYFVILTNIVFLHKKNFVRLPLSKEELSLEDSPNTDITEVIKDLIPDELPLDKKEQINQLMLISQNHSGPLPPPLRVEKYNQVIPNGAERLMKAVEKKEITVEPWKIK